MSAEAGRRPSSAGSGRKGVKGGQADATVVGIRSSSRPIRGPEGNNTGVGSRANHAAHAFSGVIEEGPPPSAQWPGFVDFSGTTNGSEPGGGDHAGRPQDVQVVLDETSRVESSHDLVGQAWELPHRFVLPLIAGRLHPHPARKHSTQSVGSVVNLWWWWCSPFPPSHRPPSTPPRLVPISISLQAATRPIWDPPTWIVPRLSPDPIQPARLAFFTIASPQLAPAPDCAPTNLP